MMRDAETIFSNNQEILATELSDNQYDFGENGGKAGNGEPIAFRVTVGDDFVGTGTVKVQIVASDDISTGVFDILSESEEEPASILVDNHIMFAGKIPLQRTKRQYIRFNYVLSDDAAITAGTINAQIVLDQPETFDSNSGFEVIG